MTLLDGRRPRKPSKLLALALFALPVVVACEVATGPRPPSESQYAEQSSPLVAPEATTCQWASVGYWPDPSFTTDCSFTLIHPRVAVTAGHCFATSPQQVHLGFGEQVPWSFEVDATWTRPTAGDWAYVVLDRDVTEVPILPPAMGCEDLVASEELAGAVIGFGANLDGGPNVGRGTKRFKASTTIFLDADRAGYVKATGPIGAGNGDSGGAIVTVAPDGTWRLMGILTERAADSMLRPTVTGPHVSVVVDTIERATGIDVTPCHDATGVWDPTPACRSFLGTSTYGSGTWPTCRGGIVDALSASCGPAFGTVAEAGPTDASDASDASAEQPDGAIDPSSGLEGGKPLQTITTTTTGCSVASVGVSVQAPPLLIGALIALRARRRRRVER